MDTRQSTVHFDTGRPTAPSAGGTDKKKILTLAAFALTIAVLLCFCTVIIAEIVYKVNGESGPLNSAGDIKFTTVSLSSGEVNRGELLIVNKSYPLKDKSAAGELVNVYDYNRAAPARSSYLDGSKISLLPGTVIAFNKLTNDLKSETGCEDVLLAYGYLVPKANTVECDYQHELGTVLDIKIINDEGTYKLSDVEAVAAWFKNNAHEYGFINSDPVGEYAHGSDETVASTQFRYVGVAHASYIAKNGMDLESYVADIRSKYKLGGEHLRFVGADGDSYEVYYVPVSGSTTSVSVPENYEYTVSGDNIGGFIVTVNLSKPVK